MKKSVFLLLSLIIWVSESSAQKLITVYGSTDAVQYASVDSALANAIDGDQIFFPGGIFNIGDLIIDKSVMIFGTGHFPDSTVATGVSYLIGNIVLSNGASAGLITGFNISGDIKLDISGSDSVSNYTVSRCNFNNLLLSSTGLPPTNANNFSIYENVIHGKVYGANATGINCSKNFIEGSVGYFVGGVFANNNFLGFGNCSTLVNMLVAINTSNFDNNIFLYTPPVCSGASFLDTACKNNVFMNDLFNMTINFPIGTNHGSNLIIGQPINSIFVNATGNQFQYSENYHLKPGSPGIYGGSDNFDIGVYGTIDPFKEASVPFNPHIQQKSVGQTTNPQGLLNIQIRVAGQDH